MRHISLSFHKHAWGTMPQEKKFKKIDQHVKQYMLKVAFPVAKPYYFYKAQTSHECRFYANQHIDHPITCYISNTCMLVNSFLGRNYFVRSSRPHMVLLSIPIKQSYLIK